MMASLYRKIYEQQYGKIPKDSDGRSYEVHHVDGNHSNNLPENLRALTIQEHYAIHYSQGDWAACQAIAIRMTQTPKEFSELCKLAAKQRVANGFLPPVMKGSNHPFYGKTGPAAGYKWSEEQISKVTGENHWSYGMVHPNTGKKKSDDHVRKMTEQRKGSNGPSAKSVVIVDTISGIEIQSGCLKEWCGQNEINYGSFRIAVSKGRLYKQRYTYRLNNGK